MAVIGSYNAFIFLAKSPGFLPNVIIWFCNKHSALWEEAVFAKKRGEMHCFAIRIIQNLCRQSKHQYSLDLLKHILSTLDSAEDMQTFCIGQWPPN